MIALRRGLLFCVILLGSFVMVQNITFAQVDDNQKNPLTTAKHAGAADKVALIGLIDASNEDGGQEDALVNVIKGWVNWVLGILGLVALLILMYGGLLMVTAAGNEERYKKGRTILQQAAIGLIVIGIAWFIVSIVFWLVNMTSTGAESANTQE